MTFPFMPLLYGSFESPNSEAYTISYNRNKNIGGKYL